MEEKPVKRFIALVPVAAAMALSTLVGLLLGDLSVALGALLGALAASLYVASFVQSHVARRSTTSNVGAASSASIRLMLLAATTVGLGVLNNRAAIGFVIAVASNFLLLIAIRLPAIQDEARDRGLVGKGGGL